MNRINVLLDNNSIHKSKKSPEHFRNLGVKVLFLSEYSPDYAPVELLFNTLKWRIAIHAKGRIANIKKDFGLRLIKKFLATIRKDGII